jgi:hypothetical protein
MLSPTESDPNVKFKSDKSFTKYHFFVITLLHDKSLNRLFDVAKEDLLMSQ